MAASSRVSFVLAQIESARKYTLALLADVADDDWFRMPPGVPTHLAWQIGHIAMAEYGLALFRIRGRKEEDLELMSSTFRKQFSRGSTPASSPGDYPPLAEIRRTFDRVHAQVLQELPLLADGVLDEPVEEPYFSTPTKFGALMLCSHHEMVHAGQIGLLRRMLGKAPVR